MKRFKKVLILSFVSSFWILPSFAKIDGNISKRHFFDVKNTIMTKFAPENEIRTEKYWEQNLLYFNKYRPLFMLSNRELYNLMPKDNVSVSQRISTPSIYNISLKTASINAVSFKPAIKKQEIQEKTEVVEKSDYGLISLYNQAKSPEVETEKKFETAVLIKDSNKKSGYNLAIDLLDEVTQKEPYNAYAFYLKGEMYSAQNESEKAMKNYIQALKINPTSKQCCLGIAKILEPTNKVLAQKYYEKAK